MWYGNQLTRDATSDVYEFCFILDTDKLGAEKPAAAAARGPIFFITMLISLCQ